MSEPNDELLWASVPPADVHERDEFWFGDRAVHVWAEKDFDSVTSRTCFAHVRYLDWAEQLRAISRSR